MRTFSKKYGIAITNDNPDGSSAQENQAVVSLKGDPRAPDVLDVNPSFAVAGAVQGLYAKYFPRNYPTIPRAMKDTRGLWMGDYWGSVTIGYNGNLVKNPPKTFEGPAQARVQEPGRAERKPAHVGLGDRRRVRRCAGERRLAQQRRARASTGSRSEVGRQLHPGADDPQTVASGQTPISIDWDYNNFAYMKEFPSANWKVTIPSDGQYGGYYAQAVNATAPHPWAARFWQEFIYSDQGQILFLKGYAHPARFADLGQRKVIPKSLQRRSRPALYAKVKFASLGQQTTAKVVIERQWPTKVG